MSLVRGCTSLRSTRVALAAAVTVVLLGSTAEVLGRLESWRTESASAFRKGERDRVVVTDNGAVRLGHALRPLGKLGASRVWDLARSSDGTVFAATGDEGKILRRSGDDDAWSLVYDAADSQVLSLAVGHQGHLFAGTGPTGLVVDVTDPKHPAARPAPGVQYIWDLEADAKGNLYAATGPTGQLWKRSPEGTWSLLFDSRHSHLLCLVVTRDGAVVAGSDGDGIVYRIAPDGRVSVLYDAPQSEVRCLLETPDGALYAGTATDASGGSSRGPITFSGGSNVTGNIGPDAASGSLNASTTQASKDESSKKSNASDSLRETPAAGGTATPKAVTPGENAVYRIERSGAVREVFRAKALVFSLAHDGQRVLIGTGPDGQVYALDAADREATPIARLDNGHVLALLADAGKGTIAGTADPGSVVEFEPGHVARGQLLSDVKDAKLISRIGALSWRGETPKGTSIQLQVRSGNVAEPDATWSDWSKPLANADASLPDVRAGRFIQYRATLATSDPALSPELRSVTVRYQSANLAPELGKIDVPDVGALDGSIRQIRLTFKWDVSDPNEDDMTYEVLLRKEGWPEWVRLNEQPLAEKSLTWDSTSVPAGFYRLRVVASDRRSNGPAEAFRSTRESDLFVIDHEAPAVKVEAAGRRVNVALRDTHTRIVKAAYAVDGGEWVPVFPDDGLFDTAAESVTIDLARVGPGSHVVVVRATDASGNLGTGDVLLTIP